MTEHTKNSKEQVEQEDSLWECYIGDSLSFSSVVTHYKLWAGKAKVLLIMHLSNIITELTCTAVLRNLAKLDLEMRCTILRMRQ